MFALSLQVCSTPGCLTHRIEGSLLLSRIELWPAVNTFDYDKRREGGRKKESVQKALFSVDLRTRSVSFEMPHIGVGY